MECYQIIKEVGSGSYGSVFQAVNKDTREVVAIKKLKQRYSSWETCLNMIEVKSLSRMDHHPNVVKLMELIKDEYDNVFFVFEYMGYNLHQLLSSRYPRGPLTEHQVRTWSFQIFQGLAHVHQCGFFHRDLKPENLLVSTDFNTVKIADFGMARETDSLAPLTRHVTTQWYRAPEVLLGSNNYTSAVDMWAMGAIMMELITLRPLFPGSTPLHQLNMMANLIGSPTRVDWPEGIDLASACKYRLPDADCGSLSELMPPGYSQHALNLIYLLLSWDPSVRPTASEVLRHPFFDTSCSWSSSVIRTSSGTYFERNCNHYIQPHSSFAAAMCRPPPGFA